MEVVRLEAFGAIVFLPRDETGSSLFLEPILFDPAAVWLSAALEHAGVERFLIVCDSGDCAAAEACFPDGAQFVTTNASDAPERLAAFLSTLEGQVVVVTRPVLLVQGMAFRTNTPPRETGVFTLDSQALSMALEDGEALEVALRNHGEQIPDGKAIPISARMDDRATVEAIAKTLGCDRMFEAGVRVVDHMNAYIGPRVSVGAGTSILPGTILRGRTIIGEACEIGPNTMIRDCVIGDRVTVNASQLNEATVGDGTTVGPFAYVRPNTHVGKDVKVGDFVELKNSTVGDGTKISHLTYVGDTDAGRHINFGCGTVTVNYDGTQKFRTTIGDHAFIGCNTNLVAPVRVGEGAYTAAGSTITDDVPPQSLAIARDRQTVKRNWVLKRRRKD